MTLRRKARREGLTSKAGAAGHWPLGPLLTGRVQGGWGESGPSGPAAPTGQGGHSGDWGLALQPGQEQLSRLDPHVDRAASSPWWVTPTHPRPCSHGTLTQEVWGGAGQDPSCPAPRRRRGAALEAIIQPAATKASSPRPNTQQPRPEIQPRACCPSCMGVQHSVLRVACGVCRDGLWTASAQTSPPSSSVRPCFPWSCQEEEKSPYDGRGQSQGLPWPGLWVWPYPWAPHLPRILELQCWHRVCDGSHSSGGRRQEQSPLAPGPQQRSG